MFRLVMTEPSASYSPHHGARSRWAGIVCLLFAGCAASKTEVELRSLRAELDALAERVRAAEGRGESMANRLTVLDHDMRRLRQPTSQVTTIAAETSSPSGASVGSRRFHDPTGQGKSEPPVSSRAVAEPTFDREVSNPAETPSDEAPVLITSQQLAELERRDGPSPTRGHFPLERRTTPVASSEVAVGDATPEVPGFSAALARYQRGDFQGAYRELEGLLGSHPGHPRLDSVVFWMGQAQFELKAWAFAANHYAAYVAMRPAGDQRALALYRLGRSREELGADREAVESYREVLREFPRTGTAELAQARLDELNRRRR